MPVRAVIYPSSIAICYAANTVITNYATITINYNP